MKLFSRKMIVLSIITLVSLSSCSTSDEEPLEEWPEKGEVTVKITVNPSLQNDQFEFSWFYGENGDGDFFSTLKSGQNFQFKSPVISRFMGITPWLRFDPSTLIGNGADAVNGSTKCYTFDVILEFAGKEFDRQSFEVGKSPKGAFKCDFSRVFMNSPLPS